MASLFWKTVGTGTIDLILLHGWGFNSAIWSYIIVQLSNNFRLHVVDLPGYGYSRGYGMLTLEQITNEILSYAPKNALWLGWSLGGLIATQAAYQYPQNIRGLITVASSPYFCADKSWPGVKPLILQRLAKQLCKDYANTVEQFFNLQQLSVECFLQDIIFLKKLLLAQSTSNIEILMRDLLLLCTCDLRLLLNKLTLPMLRIYGYLDTLVPRAVIPLVNKLCPQSKNIIFKNASHAPFISYPNTFCQKLYNFSKDI